MAGDAPSFSTAPVGGFTAKGPMVWIILEGRMTWSRGSKRQFGFPATPPPGRFSRLVSPARLKVQGVPLRRAGETRRENRPVIWTSQRIRTGSKGFTLIEVV